MSDLTWPAERMATLIDVSPRRLQQLAAEGILPRETRGRYNPFKVTPAYIKSLRDRKDGIDESGISEASARKALNIARCAEIELGMEVTRKERIPIEILNDVNDDILQTVSALIKAHKGSLLTEEIINDIFSAFRSIPDKLKWQTI